MDDKVTIEDLRQEAEKFVTDRNWSKFHSPKNLSMSIAIEASELMEIFQWESSDDSKDIANDPKRFTHLKEELSDILLYCFNFANELNFDISEAVRDKIKKNNNKYPIEEVLKLKDDNIKSNTYKK